MTDRYLVVGNPIKQTKSPLLHRAFASQCGEAIDYQAECAPLDGFAGLVERFRAKGGRGMNVTVPFKVEAYELATELTARARQAQAVNTLKFEGDSILGDNTDGAGLVADITERLGYAISGKRLLVMGAGGAARGIILPLLEKQPASLLLVNRTREKAEQLAAQFAAYGTLSVADYADLGEQSFDLVVNATSASLQGVVPAIGAANFAPGALAYDLAYGDADTAFMRFAREAGVKRVADGLGMLVAQAAEAFFLWRGKRVDTAPVIALLRGQ